ncbi:MAG: methionine--tRNA ligase, partial [Candidatus Methylomirabilales bacterium]
MSRPPFFVTTPIYYVNALPHLGHAYTTILADTLARFKRFTGYEVFFLTGTDEHGDKIAQAAAAAGEPPKAYADRVSAAFREAWARLNLSHDDFIRTTEDRHVRVVQQVLMALYTQSQAQPKGQEDLYFGEYGGHYCYGCERFYAEREMVGGQCPDHQTPLTFIKEQNYFFRMSKYQDWLVRHLEEHPDTIRPERYRNEVRRFLDEPLEDLCISRPVSRLQWGIPLPFDPHYVTYVWFDALINYVTALGYPDDPRFTRFWPAANHLIAKDILKPHGVYWPTMLKAMGREPYRHLNVHGYWKIEEGKMSKSRGTVVRPLDLTAKYGQDAFRYFLLREMVFGLDASFSEEALVRRLNADLANDLGNLLSRTIAMLDKYLAGQIPDIPAPATDLDSTLYRLATETSGMIDRAMEALQFHRALEAIWELINALNRYIDSAKPWELAKRDREALPRVLGHAWE